jgi:hypothetical protein
MSGIADNAPMSALSVALPAAHGLRKLMDEARKLLACRTGLQW